MLFKVFTIQLTHGKIKEKFGLGENKYFEHILKLI